MTSECIKTGREEKIVSLYQLDPGFYKKILSRNPSLKCSSSISVYRNPGGVPFTWEMQPGKPREASKTEIARPIRLPPAVHGLNMPKPRFHHSGPLAYLSKHVEKAKKIKNMQLRLPAAVPSWSIPRMAPAKVKLLKCSEKVKKIKNIYLGKKWKAKPMETSIGFATGADDSDDFRSCIDFTPSPSTSDACGSTLSSSFSFHQAKKSPRRFPRRFRSWNLSMELTKCRINK